MYLLHKMHGQSVQRPHSDFPRCTNKSVVTMSNDNKVQNLSFSNASELLFFSKFPPL